MLPDLRSIGLRQVIRQYRKEDSARPEFRERSEIIRAGKDGLKQVRSSLSLRRFSRARIAGGRDGDEEVGNCLRFGHGGRLGSTG